ncbi:flavin reductase [Verrucosispora sp. WMMA2044]|uniref:flavin reductase n=1 Tax=Verrucosispora sp. WMMA2044 TaxID=3016419 RepID=UPI00248BC6D2|nr:flavin reductase [Verrucosispora sp. WMMA2044]WBB48672.1 flavin reductase [Verrucosispora sp. WMMA2044]
MRRRRPEHVPSRPTWRCRNCGARWPCGAAKLRLLRQYRGDRVALLVHLVTLYAQADAQLGDTSSAVGLFDRFVSWARVRGQEAVRVPSREPDRDGAGA